MTRLPTSPTHCLIEHTFDTMREVPLGIDNLPELRLNRLEKLADRPLRLYYRMAVSGVDGNEEAEYWYSWELLRESAHESPVEVFVASMDLRATVRALRLLADELEENGFAPMAEEDV